jgi:hypothetical protein
MKRQSSVQSPLSIPLSISRHECQFRTAAIHFEPYSSHQPRTPLLSSPHPARRCTFPFLAHALHRIAPHRIASTPSRARPGPSTTICPRKQIRSPNTRNTMPPVRSYEVYLPDTQYPSRAPVHRSIDISFVAWFFPRHHYPAPYQQIPPARQNSTTVLVATQQHYCTIAFERRILARLWFWGGVFLT